MTAKNKKPWQETRPHPAFSTHPATSSFKLWRTEPRHLAQVVGHEGFTNPVCDSMPARRRESGSTCRARCTVYLMGRRNPGNRSRRPPRLHHHGHAGRDGEPFLVNLNTDTFDDLDGRPKLTCRPRRQAEQTVGRRCDGRMDQGWSET